jgi:hypothetical protein
VTYDELTEVGNTVFEEYLPKTGAKARKVFLDALFTELEDLGALEVDDDIPTGDGDDDDVVPDDED